MSVNAVKDAIPASGTQSYSLMRAAFAAGMVLPLIDASAVAAFNAEDNAAEFTTYLAVHYSGSVYTYDSADTTSTHDPAGGVIVDGSGRRYIRDRSVEIQYLVKDKDLTAPPGSPGFGDAYVVAAGATGAWAGRDGDYALYTDRGWIFETIGEGRVFYVEDEELFYYYDAGGSLAQFPGAAAIANSSIELKHLESPFGCAVEAEQNAPPGGTPPDRIKYIVGAAPTGAWAGQNAKVAEYDSTLAAWVFHAAEDGDFVNDKASGYLKTFDGSAWNRLVAAPITLQYRYLEYTSSNGFGSTWTTVFTVASFAAISASNFLYATGILRIQDNGGSDPEYDIGIFVDSEASPRDTISNIQLAAMNDQLVPFSLLFQPSDTNPHTIELKVRVTNANTPTVKNRCTMELQERFVA